MHEDLDRPALWQRQVFRRSALRSGNGPPLGAVGLVFGSVGPSYEWFLFGMRSTAQYFSFYSVTPDLATNKDWLSAVVGICFDCEFWRFL